MTRQVFQKPPFFGADNLVCVINRNGPIALVVVGFVGAAAIIGSQPDAFIVVSGNRRDFPFPDQPDYFVGIRRVAHQIALAIDGIGLSAVNVGQHSLQRRQVGVDVAEKGYVHFRICLDLTATFFISGLHGRTLHISITAIHATIAVEGF